MKYIKSFEKHRKKETINEEFIGGILKKLKNKLSLSLSKNFGRAKDVDNLIEDYKKQIFSLSDQKNKILVEYAKYIKQNEEIDPKKSEELNKKYQAADNNFKQQVEILKKKFDIQFNEIISEEKNPKIKNYIQLKKLEMQQEMLSNELKYIFDVGLSEEELEKISTTDPNFGKIIDSIKGKMKKSEEQIVIVSNDLKVNSDQKDDNSYFSIKEEDMEKVKSEKGFEESAFVKGEVKFKEGDKIKYWSTSDGGKENDAVYVGEDKEDQSKIEVKIGDNNVKIYKSRVISKGEKPKEEAKKPENTEAPKEEL